jgi:23S rRNA pseudouridine1911/1915/1917 synthase
MQMPILYEDNHVIAVRKPHGMLVQSDGTDDVTLINTLRYFLKQREYKPGNVFLGLVHRLDRPVGGVIVFGKTSKGAARLSDQFRVHSVEKVYWAVVESTGHEYSVGSEGVVKHWLLKDEVRNVVTAHASEVPRSQHAETAWKILRSTKDGRLLVEVRPETGRSHQIRVAMASLGMPIFGDMKYGSPAAIALPNGSTALGLMARSLSFDQAVTKERVTAVAEPELDCFA